MKTLQRLWTGYNRLSMPHQLLVDYAIVLTAILLLFLLIELPLFFWHI